MKTEFESRVSFRKIKLHARKQSVYLAAIYWNKEDNFVPDYDNSNQRKYYPWFWKCKEDFRFDFSLFVYSFADAGSGSRLCFKTPERAEQFGIQFIELHNDVLLLD